MYASRYRFAKVRLGQVRNTKSRVPIDRNATAYAKLEVSISGSLTEPMQLQDWWKRHVRNLRACSHQPRDLWAKLSLPDYPDFQPRKAVLMPHFRVVVWTCGAARLDRLACQIERQSGLE
jgi:hypothetical protein